MTTPLATAAAAVVALCLAIAATVQAGDPDVGRDMVEIVQARGYPIQEYYPQTPDGYILGLFRIPYGRTPQGAPRQGKPVVFLQHGLLDSSWTWVNNFEQESLAFILADAGYDVWLGNNRGNYYSTAHAWLDPDSSEFWAFSYDEMAQYDLPTQVNYALNATGQEKLVYVGHSQGTTQAFAAFSEQPELNSKVALFVALAPVAYVDHQKSILISLLADFDIANILKFFGFKDFLPDAGLLQKLAPGICELVPWGCDDILFLLCGASNNLNESRTDVYVSETPAGTSTQNMVHWSQGVKANAFQHYDYGCGLFSCENEKKYGQKTPPPYNLQNITIPTALFFGDDDDLADPTDVQTLINSLPHDTVVYALRTPNYAHLDYTWGVNANTNVYSHVLDLVKKYLG